ncbi:hypothetical protein Acy02nite_73740 [Actinoplanes cyaneus]|uniref:DUF4407 domain-containing protein n=1 Tax=Actinoplanes cyaneus TaxID=52696 RepID=A0A919ITT0_9ACTN|nr:DUF4407 domain-containing protein [Actinoplanes cyaneus]MCW2135508.1 protein of unknown function (DUF4407) [Actinoplanes cyaneus]GID69493.1 hypothetical protein Acy02nite_73740 [Actinoplanes cyaneus]
MARLLIWLSGADVDTLERSPRERRKFSGLGGVVLTTACMAAISSAFALHNGARAPLWAAVPVALLWGLAIANLDRWLVAAASRRERWWQNLFTLLPRLLLALVIGAVVSTPLVLWIFQREIQAQLTVDQQADRNRFEAALRADARFAPIPELEAEVVRLQRVAAGAEIDDVVGKDPAVVQAKADFDQIDKKWARAEADALCEFDGSCGSKRKGGGSAYQKKLQYAHDLRVQRDAAAVKLDAAKNTALNRQKTASTGQQADARGDLPAKQAELARLKQVRADEQDRYLIDSRNDRGLLAQIEALSEITGRNGTLKTAYLTLLVFITAVEILPVLTKFLLNIGPATVYDQILASAEKADVELARSTLKVEHEHREKEFVARSEREATIGAELRDRELRRWRAGELRRLRGQGQGQGPSGAPGRRRPWAAPRPEPAPADGYNDWPDDETGGRATVAGPAIGGGDPDETDSMGWRFRQD